MRVLNCVRVVLCLPDLICALCACTRERTAYVSSFYLKTGLKLFVTLITLLEYDLIEIVVNKNLHFILLSTVHMSYQCDLTLLSFL